MSRLRSRIARERRRGGPHLACVDMMPGRRRPSLLPWIIAFKIFKALALTLAGVTLLATRHQDPADVVIRAALAVHLPLSSELFARAFRFATSLSLGKQIALGITAFAYAALMSAEGIALYLRKPWARWFTIGATISLIPIELYEIFRDATPVRILVLLLNIAVVVYLWLRKDILE